MLTDKILKLANSEGINLIGFTDVSPFEGYAFSGSRRIDPKLTLPDAKSIIVIGIYIGGMALSKWSDPDYGRTSRLYLSNFFLDVISPLKPIQQLLNDEGYKAIICDSFSEETSAIPLKLAAIRAGLGWQGKNSLLVTKKYGTYIALGGIITDAKLKYSTETSENLCRDCTKCLQSCPTTALDEPYKLNLKKCLSYMLQIENFPVEEKSIVENRVGDCEICQDACPWNKRHITNPLETDRIKSFTLDSDRLEKLFHLDNLSKMTKEDYQEQLSVFRTSIPYEIFRRNVLLAVDNKIL